MKKVLHILSPYTMLFNKILGHIAFCEQKYASHTNRYVTAANCTGITLMGVFLKLHVDLDIDALSSYYTWRALERP